MKNPDQEELDKWTNGNCEELRYQYPLNKDSICFDLGAFHGDWSIKISDMYDKPTIYAFEPVENIAKIAENKIKNYPNIKLFNFGMGKKNENLNIKIGPALGVSTSLFEPQISEQTSPQPKQDPSVNFNLNFGLIEDGTSEILISDIKIINLEFNFNKLLDQKFLQDKKIKYLNSCGEKFLLLKNGGVVSIPIPEILKDTNYLIIIKCKKISGSGKLYCNISTNSQIEKSNSYLKLNNNFAECCVTLNSNKSNEDNIVPVKIKAANEVIKELKIKKIDLMKLNIEGSEYDVLESIIENKLQTKIKNIQVQFHRLNYNYYERYVNIKKELSKTHHLTYEYPFIWENWELNS